MGWLRARIGLRAEEGQTIVFVVAALPLLLAIGALIIDGSNLFVNKRSLQNAADASALAAAADLAKGTCASTCAASTGKYAGYNGGNHAAVPSDPNSQSP